MFNNRCMSKSIHCMVYSPIHKPEAFVMVYSRFGEYSHSLEPQGQCAVTFMELLPPLDETLMPGNQPPIRVLDIIAWRNGFSGRCIRFWVVQKGTKCFSK